MEKSSSLETAVFGGGCFWCTEAIFKKVKGVEKVVSGYAGGNVDNPNYEKVILGYTGHVEVVKIEFNPKIISYSELLDIFWHVHDPTSIDRQGADVGTQYRSVIFYTSDEQKKLAEESNDNLEKSEEYKEKIVTKIEKLDQFYSAEEYHQNYFENNLDKPYCQLIIAPKLKKLLDKYSEKIKS